MGNMLVRQLRRQWRPHFAGIAKAAHQYHGRPLPADDDMNGRPFGLDFLGMKRGGERRDLGVGR